MEDERTQSSDAEYNTQEKLEQTQEVQKETEWLSDKQELISKLENLSEEDLNEIIKDISDARRRELLEEISDARRRGLLEEVLDYINRSGGVSLIGPRRMGKSSLLNPYQELGRIQRSGGIGKSTLLEDMLLKDLQGSGGIGKYRDCSVEVSPRRNLDIPFPHQSRTSDFAVSQHYFIFAYGTLHQILAYITRPLR
jgi:hypothetical protein